MSSSLQPQGRQLVRVSCPSLSPRVCSNSCPLNQQYYPSISFSVTPFSPALSLSQHQGLFQWVSSSHQIAKILELKLQHQSFQWTPRTDLLQDGLVGSLDSQESSPTPQFKSISSSVPSLSYSPTLTSVHDYWEKPSFNYMDLC